MDNNDNSECSTLPYVAIIRDYRSYYYALIRITKDKINIMIDPLLKTPDCSATDVSDEGLKEFFNDIKNSSNWDSKQIGCNSGDYNLKITFNINDDNGKKKAEGTLTFVGKETDEIKIPFPFCKKGDQPLLYYKYERVESS